MKYSARYVKEELPFLVTANGRMIAAFHKREDAEQFLASRPLVEGVEYSIVHNV